jgi:hypothetical protein
VCFTRFPYMLSLWHFHPNSEWFILLLHITSLLSFLFLFHTTSVHICLLHSICFILYLWMVSFIFPNLNSICFISSVYEISYNASLKPCMFYTTSMHDFSYFSYLILCFMLFLCMTSLLFSLLQSRWNLYHFYSFVTFSSKFCLGSISFWCIPHICSINGGYLCWCVLFPLLILYVLHYFHPWYFSYFSLLILCLYYFHACLIFFSELNASHYFYASHPSCFPFLILYSFIYYSWEWFPLFSFSILYFFVNSVDLSHFPLL